MSSPGRRQAFLLAAVDRRWPPAVYFGRTLRVLLYSQKKRRGPKSTPFPNSLLLPFDRRWPTSSTSYTVPNPRHSAPPDSSATAHWNSAPPVPLPLWNSSTPSHPQKSGNLLAAPMPAHRSDANRYSSVRRPALPRSTQRTYRRGDHSPQSFARAHPAPAGRSLASHASSAGA